MQFIESIVLLYSVESIIIVYLQAIIAPQEVTKFFYVFGLYDNFDKGIILSEKLFGTIDLI